MNKIKNGLFVSFCLLATLSIFNECTDNAGSPYPPEEEAAITLQKIAGLVLFCNGKIAAMVDKTTVQGVICVKREQSSNIVEVEFVDESGEVIEKDPQLYRLAWNHDPAYATFEQHQEWSFCICGHKVGVTTFEIKVEDGSSVEYKSPPIPLQIL